MHVGKKKGQGRCGYAPGRESMAWVLCFEGFYLSLAGGNLRGGLRGGFQQNIHKFSRCAFSGLWFPVIGQHQGRGHWSLQLVPVSPSWSPCFSGPGDGMQLRPRCYLEGTDLCMQL